MSTGSAQADVEVKKTIAINRRRITEALRLLSTKKIDQDDPTRKPICRPLVVIIMINNRSYRSSLSGKILVMAARRHGAAGHGLARFLLWPLFRPCSAMPYTDKENAPIKKLMGATLC